MATVANIDWPSEPGLSAFEQQHELRALLDRVVELNMNAVVFQIRPAADALYESALEPWSEYLTGQMGSPPEPYYDPLAFAIHEAHRRGLELHAWFNPFRALHKTSESLVSPRHITETNPELVVRYGDQWWMDPGNPDAQQHSLNVIRDVVKRYDIDGVHIDDYFYPYPVKGPGGRSLPFPDDKSWEKAQEKGVTLSRDDWRRENINRFIERLYATIKLEKPWVKVGISPFGIWRPGHPEPIRGLDAYLSLYADSRLWLQRGWVDYMSPQLYWSINSSGQSFPKLYEWWKTQNTRNRHLWPGSAIYRIDSHGWKEEEILNQIRITRSSTGKSGNILFSMRILDEGNNRLGDHLSRDVYAEPALIPDSPWLYAPSPRKPSISVDMVDEERATLNIRNEQGNVVRRWVVRVRYGSEWKLAIVPGATRTYSLPTRLSRSSIQEVVVSGVNRTGEESAMARVEMEETIAPAGRLGF